MFYPMWNEAETIHRAVAAACDAGDRLIADGELASYDILIVDDASTDDTGVIADKLAGEDDRIRVVHHPFNRKLGGSLKTGFAEATGDLILYTDADLPFDMAELSKAVRLLRIYDADIVSAYRFDRTGEGPRRLVYSYAYNHLIQTVFGLRLRDMNFSFKLVPPVRLRPHRAEERGVVHRRRAVGPGSAPRLRDRPVRGRLLPPQPGRLHAVVERGDHPARARDARASQRARIADASPPRAASTRR